MSYLEYPTAVRCPACGETLSCGGLSPKVAPIPWHGGPSGVCGASNRTLAEVVPGVELNQFLAGWVREVPGSRWPEQVDPWEVVRGG